MSEVKVGVGLLLIKGNKVLLSRRKGSHGEGEYAAIGGHVEHLETLEQAIRRELAEECGPDVKIKNLRPLCTINLRSYRPKLYLDIGFVAEWVAGEPKLMEPHKMERWDWHSMTKLPKPIFAVDPLYVMAYQTGQYYFEA